MVRSILNPKLEYPENSNLNEKDSNFDAQVWAYNLYGDEIYIAIGNKNTIDGIDSFPIYLIKNDIVESKIGVFEMIDASKYLDNEEDLDINLLDEPLLFSFVDKQYLDSDISDSITKQSDDTSDNETETTTESIESIEDNALISVDPNFVYEPLPEQTQSMAELEREIDPNGSWVSKYLENPNFNIIDVPGDGDCFFTVVHEALKSVGKNISVVKMRRLLSKHATEAEFREYYTLYKNVESEHNNLKDKLKNMKTKYDSIKSDLGKSTVKNEHLELISNSEKILEQYNIISEEKRGQKELLEEFKFMKGVNTLADFKDKILLSGTDSVFWADTWAISTIERLLNIKIIPFSTECYVNEDCDNLNVIQCGQLNDKILEEKGNFNPDYYILTNFTGNHYQLITFKGKKIFTFKELLFTIRLKIVEACLEKDIGPFALIDDFTKLKKSLDITTPERETEPIQGDLYDDSIVFKLNYKSPQPNKRPGQGEGETIPVEKIGEFINLTRKPLKKWRQILSNMHIDEFKCDNKRWSSIEHYIQASRFQSKPDIYNEFTIESGSDLSRDPELARSYGLDTIYKKHRVRPKGLQDDENFKESEATTNAIKCKINQIPIFKDALINTKNAKLDMYISRKPVRTQTELMEIRRLVNIKEL